MKKLFTLIAMALVSMSVSAKNVLTLPDDMGAGKTTNFTSWQWRDVAKLYSGEEINNADASDAGVVYFDASEYDYLVIKYKELSVKTNFGIQYNSKGTVGQWGPELYGTQIELTANTSGVVGVALDADHKNKVYKVYLQTQGEGSLIVEEVYLGSKAEYDADVAANPVESWYPATKALSVASATNTWNDKTYTEFDATTGKVKIVKNNGAQGWWLGSDADFAYYDYFVLELADVQKSGYLQLNNGTFSEFGNGSYVKLVTLPEKDANGKRLISQMMIQGGEGTEFTIKNAYFATAAYVKENNIKDATVYGDTQEIALSGLSPWKDGETARATFDATTGVLTITGDPDGGAGWWQGSADFSHFDNFVVELAETTVGGAVVVQYVAEEAAAASRRANVQNKVEFGKGATNIVVPLNATNKNAVQQMWIQGNKDASYTIKKAYFAVASATPEANIGTIENAGGEEATGVTYQFDNKAATYVLGDNCSATTYTMDEQEGFAVNYTGTESAKMQVKLAANEEIFFEYSNSATKNYAIKTGANFMQCDSKNFVINIPVKTGDVVYVKYSAKGSSNPAELDVYGSEPAITADADAVKTCSGTKEADAVIFKATATKGGTAKIKETKGGMRIYAISINQVPTGIQQIAAPVKAAVNGAIYNLAGQKVNENYKGIVIKNGKKYFQK